MSGSPPRAGTLFRGGGSERPKEHASKACEGASPPWVQIPPPPPGASTVPELIGRQIPAPHRGRYLSIVVTEPIGHNAVSVTTGHHPGLRGTSPPEISRRLSPQPRADARKGL